MLSAIFFLHFNPFVCMEVSGKGSLIVCVFFFFSLSSSLNEFWGVFSPCTLSCFSSFLTRAMDRRLFPFFSSFLGSRIWFTSSAVPLLNLYEFPSPICDRVYGACVFLFLMFCSFLMSYPQPGSPRFVRDALRRPLGLWWRLAYVVLRPLCLPYVSLLFSGKIGLLVSCSFSRFLFLLI